MLCAMVAHATFSRMLPGGERKSGVDHVHLGLGGGLAVMLGVVVSGGVSGAHLNPALSVVFALMGRLSWKMMLVYCAAQYTGAMVASVGLYGMYRDTLDIYDGGIRQVSGPNATASIWATYPVDHVSWVTAFNDQVLATAVLMFGILAIVDEKNWSVPKHMVPLYIGALIMSLILSLGYNTGAAMNPARDLMPRLFTYIAGWGVEVFSIWQYTWFWIPIVGPHVGALIGAVIYQTLIGIHWPREERTLRNAADANEETTMNLAAPPYKLRFEGFSPNSADEKQGDPTRVPLTKTTQFQ